MTYVPDESTREITMKSGGGDVMTANPKLASRFDKAQFNIISRPAGTINMVSDSANADSPWSKPDVRLALDYALDRQALANAFTYGFGTAAYQLAPTTSIAFYKGATERKLDVAKAKELLTKAGYPNGFKSKLVVAPGTIDPDLPVAIQAQLLKAGIDISIESPQAAAYQQFLTNPWNNALVVLPVPEWSNFNTTLNVFFADPGRFYFKSTSMGPGWAELYKSSLTAPQPDPAILQNVGKQFYENAVTAPLYHYPNVFVVSKKVNDHGLLTTGTFNHFDHANVWLSK
jgi:ABC-type transport system substrate-binding protein